jgi:DNA-binding NtrC family response regulator
MSKNNKVCTILIIDNDVEYAKKVAFELEEIRPDLLQGYTLKLEISNTAYFIGNWLANISNGTPPWDIILSDVYMPIPSSPLDRNTPREDALPQTLNHQGKKWNSWEYEYTWNSHLDGTPDHGGLYVAQKVQALRKISNNFNKLKVILISDKLFNLPTKEKIYKLLRSEYSWFNYYDKTNWIDNTADWPHLNKPNIFRWAIIHAINERESDFWGDFIPDKNNSIITISKALKEIVIQCKTLGKDKSVNRILIAGERGTGKSRIARMIHQFRMKELETIKEFVTVECTSISNQLFEDNLFGHIKGAFTGAERETQGFVERAKGGTLFFDEIGDLSPNNQGKILRLLQENKFVKVGDNKNIEMKANLVVFATNKNLEQLIEEGSFRADLYDRMNPPPIVIPPLRDRNDEIVPLAEHFIKSSNKDIRLSEEAKQFLKAQNWEGNVRQLQKAISQAATSCTSIELSIADLQQAIPIYFSRDQKNISAPSHHNSEGMHEFTPENILKGKIKWASIKRKPYHERAAVMVIAKSMWNGSQSQLAYLLDVRSNSLEKFFSTLRNKFKENELELENLKPHIIPEYHSKLEQFFSLIPPKPIP